MVKLKISVGSTVIAITKFYSRLCEFRSNMLTTKLKILNIKTIISPKSYQIRTIASFKKF